jgi:hypothetical protein
MKGRLLVIWHSNGAPRTTTENCLLRVFARTNNFLNRLTEGGENALDLPLCCLHQPKQQSELPHSANQLSDLCSLDQPNHSFPAILYLSRRWTVAAKDVALASWKETMEYDPYH